MQPLNEIRKRLSLSVRKVFPGFRFDGRAQDIGKVVLDLFAGRVNAVKQVVAYRVVIGLSELVFASSMGRSPLRRTLL